MQACCVDWMHRSPRFPCRSAPSFSLSRRPRHSHAWVSYPPSPYPFYFLLGRQDLNKGGQQITVKCYDGKVKQKEAVTRLIVLPKMVRPPKSLISTRPCAPLSLSGSTDKQVKTVAPCSLVTFCCCWGSRFANYPSHSHEKQRSLLTFSLMFFSFDTQKN